MVENTNLTMNSKKAWATIRRLGADNVSPPVVTTVTADQIANQLLSNGRRVEHRRPPGEHHKTIVPSNNQPPTELTKPFSLDALATGLSLLKAGKAAGLDGLLTEMLPHLGNTAKYWLLDMLNECTSTKHIPSIWRKAKVIAIPKPGKDPSSPKSYRPISLLCIPYKLYERLILMRISPLVDEKLTKDQAGFRPGRSCTGQLLNLTQHIEDGYERKMLTGAAFVDLSAAYVTVQHRLMIRKLMDMTGDIDLCQVIRGLLSNRRFFVQLNDKSRWRSQKNGLPQGSVLAPLLFNIYTNDQPLPTDCSI